MKKAYLLFPISLILFFSIVFLSFRYEEITSVVEGTVKDKDGQPIFNAEVFLAKEGNDRIDYYEPTGVDGKFTLTFNAVEGRPLDVFVRKNDRILASEKIIPTSHQEKIELDITIDKDKGSAVTLNTPEKAADHVKDKAVTATFKFD